MKETIPNPGELAYFNDFLTDSDQTPNALPLGTTLVDHALEILGVDADAPAHTEGEGKRVTNYFTTNRPDYVLARDEDSSGISPITN